MMKKRLLGLLIILAIGETIARAEMRIWTDMKGNTVEAEYERMASGQIVLKTPKGKQLKIPANGLSKKDKEYIRNSIPPKIKMEVEVKKGGGKTAVNSGEFSHNSSQTRTAQLHVSLTKKSNAPCDQQFTAWLYLFAKGVSGGGRAIIDVSVQDFSFVDQKTIELSGKSCRLRVRRNSSGYSKSKYGAAYDGYLVCIVDSNKKLVLLKGSSKKYEEKVENILGRAKKSQYDKNLEPTGKTKWYKVKKKKKKGGKHTFTF